jgi:hypothetical protein
MISAARRVRYMAPFTRMDTALSIYLNNAANKLSKHISLLNGSVTLVKRHVKILHGAESLFMFAYDLFNVGVNSSECIASNVRIINE